MTEEQPLRRTVLYDWHLEHGARMAAFGGYQMPLWYETGARTEHLRVITAAGLFDTSHMAVLTVGGPGSLELLQYCFTKDLDSCLGRQRGPLRAGRCVYGLFLNQDGTVLDDAIVSRLDQERFLVVVNCSMGEAVAAHLGNWAGTTVSIVDYGGTIGKIDLQGPVAASVLERVLADPEAVLADLVYFSFAGDIFAGNQSAVTTRDGCPLLLSRTGYTGEFGFELFAPAGRIEELWEQLLAAGRELGVLACGLAARDSLRAGALLPLSHQDIGPWLFANTPWSFVLPWDRDKRGFTKDFIGAAAVAAGCDDSYTSGFAGFDPRKIQPGAKTRVLDKKQQPIGRILSCTTDMAIDRVDGRIISVATPVKRGRPVDFRPRGLACGLIMTRRPCRVGETVYLSDGRRTVPVEIREEIRPDRSARRPMVEMRTKE